MEGKVVKGVVEKCSQKAAYDRDGNEYQEHWITINKVNYTAKIPKGFYVETGMKLVLVLKSGSDVEVSSGYCAQRDYKWGSEAKALKKQLGPEDLYEYMEGTVTEKRKDTTGPMQPNRPMGGTRTSYVILLKNGSFRASRDEGEWLQIGMDIAVVLKENSPVLILDKRSGKISGLAKRYYVLFLALIPILIATKFLLTKNAPNFTFLPNGGIIVLVVFLALASLLNILTFTETNRAKKFLMSKLGR